MTFTLDVDIGMERPRAVILGQKNSSLDNHQSEAFSLSRNISVLNNIEKELTFTVLIKVNSTVGSHLIKSSSSAYTIVARIGQSPIPVFGIQSEQHVCLNVSDYSLYVSVL